MTRHKESKDISNTQQVVCLGDPCVICGGATEKVWGLANLPLTDTFTKEKLDVPFDGFDQAFRFCNDCRHGQLESVVSPKILYGGNYCFRTSASPTARKGTEFFFSVLNRVAPDRTFNCAIDLGCNDLFLLDQLAGRARHRVGVDPIWKGKEHERDGDDVQVIGAGLEEANLDRLPEKPDLIVCRHTLEHLAHPVDVIQRLLDVAAEDALFIFEVPGLEALVNRHRFDQVFHQHLQYFSQQSFLRMLTKVDASALHLSLNYHDWGAFAVAFVRADGREPVSPLSEAPDIERVQSSLEIFRAMMDTTRRSLDSLEGPVFGYGAAQMLPVLAYHLKSDMSFLDAVIDDDPEKEGAHYWNLPVRIVPLGQVSGLADASVLITAVDGAQPILERLFRHRPKHIIYPFHTI